MSALHPSDDLAAITAHLEALTDHEWATIDRLAVALEAAAGDGLTPSTAARKAKILKDGKPDTYTAHHLLDLMVAARFALTSGNGAWTHYHAYDRRRDPSLARTRRAR